MKYNIEPCHPGKVLASEFMTPMGLNTLQLSHLLNIREDELILFTKEELRLNEQLTVSLSEYFGTTQEFWNSLQDLYDAYYSA